MSSIKPFNRLCEQCHGATKTARSSNARPSLRVHLLCPRLLPSPLTGQRLRQPIATRTTASQGKPDCCLVQYYGQSRIAPHCERQAALQRTRTCRPTFPHHAATAKLPSIPTSTHHPWPDRTSTTIWFRPLRHSRTTYLPPYPLLISTPNSSLDA